MRGLKELLMAEEARLEEIVTMSEMRLKDAPNGTLRLSQSNNYLQFYHCTDENKLGKYITKGNDELIQKLAQKSYDNRVLRLAEKRLNQIKKLLRDYEDDEIEKIFIKEHKERVRSKSEKIMADYFYRNGIEYKYECPIYLKGMGMVYPDFTFLSKKTGKEIYWEHNGMVDEPSYARNMVRKIDAYENIGIFIGERLILTYETEQSVLNTGKIEQMVQKYLV